MIKRENKREYVIVGISRVAPPPNETLSLTLTPDPAEPGIPSMSLVITRADFNKLEAPTVGDKISVTISLEEKQPE